MSTFLAAPRPDPISVRAADLFSKGIDLVPVLVEIIAWSEKHHKVHPQAVAFARQIKKDKVNLINEVIRNLS